MAKSNIMKRLAIGAAIAGAAGYVAGLMTAPKSGREMRKDLSDAAGNSLGDLDKQIHSLQSELNDLLSIAKSHSGDFSGKAKDDLGGLIDKAKYSRDKMHEVVTALKSGDKANDKDLQKAITDAKKAIEHIKDFIQK
jgi:gas vesicle protein